MALTPQGRSLAQSITRSFLGYFNVTDQKSLPLPGTPQPVPTFSYEPKLVPFETKGSPAADPAQCGPTVSLLTSTPYCLLLNVQAEAGFAIKVIGTGDTPLKFDGVTVFQKRVSVGYFNENGTQMYTLTQGTGSFPLSGSPWGLVPAEAVQQVIVGSHPAELVTGQFVNTIGTPTIDWSTFLAGVHLRWQEGEQWYSIDAYRNYWNGDTASQQAEKNELIQRSMAFGQSLVPLSTGSDDLAGGLSQTPRDRVGFALLTPQALPEGFELSSMNYGNPEEGLKGAVILNYQFMDKGQWAGAIDLYEATMSNAAVDFVRYFTDVNIIPKYLLTVNDVVQVGTSTGRYMVKPDGSTALVWYRDGMKLMLRPFYDASTFGGRFTKAEIIAIAEGIQ
jgi:hypothetical protein